jgi:predicted Rdx family selenoprotein
VARNLTLPTTSVFSTKDSEPEVARLIAEALGHGDGEVVKGFWERIAKESAEWQAYLASGRQGPEPTGFRTGYSRAWLIVRRAQLEAFSADLLWSADQVAAFATERRAEYEARGVEGLTADHLLGDLVRYLMLDLHCSWGEAMCRLGWTEGRVRHLFRFGATLRDVGLRPAQRGGRFVMDKGDLYTEHRKREGAAIGAETTLGTVRDQGTEVLVNKDERLSVLIPKAEAASKAFAESLEKEIERQKAERAAARKAARAAKPVRKAAPKA